MPLNTVEGVRQGTIWVEGIIIGGSDIYQAPSASVVRIEGSGTTTTISGLTSISLGANGSVVGTRGVFTTVSGTNSQFSNISGGDFTTPLSVILTAGSPYLEGIQYRQWAAETIITGGMWVTVSGAAGGASLKARAAAASTQIPFGVCIATTASGGTPDILTAGVVYMTAEDTIANGVGIRMGAGTALNTVAPHVAGSALRGGALAGAGSEGVALVFLF